MNKIKESVRDGLFSIKNREISSKIVIYVENS